MSDLWDWTGDPEDLLRPHFEQITLEKIELRSHMSITREFLVQTKIDVDEDRMRNMFDVHLRGYVWGRRTEYEFRTPQQSRDALVQTLPRWLRRLLRLRSVNVLHTVRANLVFPKVRFASSHTIIQVAVMGGELARVLGDPHTILDYSTTIERVEP